MRLIGSGGESFSGLFAAMVFGGLLSLLSNIMVGITLPHIIADLGGDLATGQWIAAAYMLAAGLTIPIAGWAATRFGLRRAWLSAMTLFGLGSLACYLANDIWALIAARALQGLGGGALEPLMVTILAVAARPERMGRTMGAMAVIMEIGPLLGPTVGGLAVDLASWRAIYLGFSLAAAIVFLAGGYVLRKEECRSVQLDGFGLILMSAGLLGGLWVFQG